MKACPSCTSVSRHRVKRRGLLQFIPKTRAYECHRCGQSYVWNAIINSSFRISHA